MNKSSHLKVFDEIFFHCEESISCKCDDTWSDRPVTRLNRNVLSNVSAM